MQNKEDHMNGVLVQNSTKITFEKIINHEEVLIGAETVVTTQQTLYVTGLWLRYARGAWTVSKTEIATVFGGW
ncbi:hypothetical protein BFJ65_g14584 [Fusarium oxysporum f. sp. cepae]|uniref:Uncharacterized protein n=1 Tax=Fusarium oxysporum f. sp. cepae TaxID=396571 RepID=A0A3L6MZW9_FUSOX|nr:hypothetical protein BFJ65_g14584 [Fusarium oxysporum f. sp. cepae]